MLQWISEHTALAIVIIFVGFAIAEWLRGRFRSPHETHEDAPLEGAMTMLFAGAIYPGILLLVGWLAECYTPEMAGSLAHLPVWAMIGLLLIGDDLTQYWWHRASHSPLLWPLHRAHHSAPYMGIRVVYRNNFFYYAMMPGLWISAYLVFMGLGSVYPWYVLHQTLIIVALVWLTPLRLGPVGEPLLVLLATVAGCWLLCDGWIRPSRWLRPLFGLAPLPRHASAGYRLRDPAAARMAEEPTPPRWP